MPVKRNIIVPISYDSTYLDRASAGKCTEQMASGLGPVLHLLSLRGAVVELWDVSHSLANINSVFTLGCALILWVALTVTASMLYGMRSLVWRPRLLLGWWWTDCVRWVSALRGRMLPLLLVWLLVVLLALRLRLLSVLLLVVLRLLMLMLMLMLVLVLRRRLLLLPLDLRSGHVVPRCSKVNLQLLILFHNVIIFSALLFEALLKPRDFIHFCFHLYHHKLQFLFQLASPSDTERCESALLENLICVIIAHNVLLLAVLAVSSVYAGPASLMARLAFR